MPPPALFDISKYDFDRVAITREQIYTALPHRYEFMQLDGIIELNEERREMVAYRDIKPDEWWCKGHIPGRPVFPGVLMIEAAAHVASYFYFHVMRQGTFLAFSAIDRVKFRGEVRPGSRLIFVGRALEVKTRRTICDLQGFVDGTMVFEGQITGMPI